MGRLWLCFVIILSGLANPSSAQDCNKKCCEWGVCEPICKSSCELKKEAEKHIPEVDIIPTPPGVGDVKKVLEQSCASAFELINRAVIVSQGSYPAGSNNLLEQARLVLIETRLFDPKEFTNVSLRWARLTDEGQAPDRNLVFISDQFLYNRDLYGTASVMAHEMVHIRQYRRMGTDTFKCEYSKEYVRTKGRQGNEHFLEREAYEFNTATNHIVQQHIANKGFSSSAYPAPQAQLSDACVVPNIATCRMPYATPPGTLCSCMTPGGAWYGTILGVPAR